MPLTLETGSGAIAFQIGNTGNIGFGCAASSTNKLTIGGYTLLTVLFAFETGIVLSSAVLPVLVSVTTTPGQVLTIDITSYTGADNTSPTYQPVFLTPVYEAFNGVDVELSSTRITVTDTRTSGSAQTTSVNFW